MKILKLIILLCFLLVSHSKLEASIIYVHQSAQGSNIGSDWENAFVDLESGLSNAQYGDTIWVAMGTYLPTNSTDRYISFEIPNGVQLFGGFEGNETSLTQRDWVNYPTILSGDIGVENFDGDNSFTVVYLEQTDTSTTLDGVIIRDGNANSTINIELAAGATKSGGGIYLHGQSGLDTNIRILNCRFYNNYASRYGGALQGNGINGSVGFIIRNSEFMDNETGFQGGAIGKQGGCSTIQKVESTIFQNNIADDFGGAVGVSESNVNIDLIFLNCFFQNNSAHLGGAFGQTGIQINTNNLRFINCLFEENISQSFGGALYYIASSTGDVVIEACSFSENQGTEAVYVGALFNYFRKIQIKANTFYSNHGCIRAVRFRLQSVNNLFYKNTSECIRLEGALSAPLSSNSKIINNSFIKNGRAFFLQNSHAFVENSIFWENKAELNEGDNFRLQSESTLNIGNSVIDVEHPDSIAYIYVPPGGDTTSFVNVESGIQYNNYPLFRDSFNLDFSLLSCSPAINAGNNLAIDTFGITTDIRDHERVIDDVVDIGAFEQEAFEAEINEINNVTCKGYNDGSVSFDLNGTAPFEITWETQNDSGNNSINLPPGDYSFYIEDSDACMDTFLINIMEADSLLQISELLVEHVDCYNSNNGSIAVFPTGGVPDYSYEWSIGDTTSVIEDLNPGLYSITVSDQFSCTETEVIEILSPDNLTLTSSINHVNPGFQDGTITISVIQGGTLDYSFEWSNGSVFQSIENLEVGDYSLTITDSNNCNYIFDFTISFISSTDDVDCEKYMISPNPAQSFITTINSESYPFLNSEIYFFDYLGRLVLSNDFPLENLDISNIPSGLYVYFIKEKGKVVGSGKINITR